jgi:hypothetical protein
MCSPRIADCCASTKCGKREVTVIPSVSSNRSYIGRDRAFSRVFAEYLLGFEGTPCCHPFGRALATSNHKVRVPVSVRPEWPDAYQSCPRIGSAAHSVGRVLVFALGVQSPGGRDLPFNVHLLGPISVLGRPQLLAQFSEFSDVGFGSVWVSRPRRLGASWLGFG